MNLYLKPKRIVHQPGNKILTQKNFLLVIIALCLILIMFIPAHADPEANPPGQPNGNLCLPLAGGIAGAHEFINSKSGVTYQFDRPLKSAIKLPVPAQLSLYDADTTTIVTLTNGSDIVQTLVYSTGNNIWSQPQAITQPVTGIQVKTPNTHPSTNLCFWYDQATSTPTPTETPVTTVTPEAPPVTSTPEATGTPEPRAALALSIDVLNKPPTGLLVPPEPLSDASAVSDDVQYIQTGESIILYIKVMNTGTGMAKDVHVVLSGDTSTDIAAGDIDAGQIAVVTFPAISHNGTNWYLAGAGDQEVSVLWRGDSQVFLPLVIR